MTNGQRFTTLIVCWVLLLGATGIPLTHAQSLVDLERRFDAAYEKEEYEPAEQLARQGLRQAERGTDKETLIVWLDHLGDVLYWDDRGMEAVPFFERSLRLEEERQGKQSWNVAVALRKLAECYFWDEKYAEAAPLFTRAIPLIERHDPEGSDLPYCLNCLGDCQRELKQLDRAEPLLRRAIKLETKVSGKNSTDYATYLDSLAHLLTDQKKFSEAEPLYRQALLIREREFGPEDIETSLSISYIANLLHLKGNYDEAEPLYRKVLLIREQNLGPEDLDVADAVFNLALLHYDRNEYRKSSPLFRRAQSIFEKEYGPEHRDVADCLYYIANQLYMEGKYAEAGPLHKRSLAIFEKVLGPENEDVAYSLNDIANMLLEQGKYGEAEPYYRRSLAIREKILDPGHEDIAQSINNLANLYMDQGKYEEAESMFRRSLSIYEKRLGKEHYDVAMSLNNLALVMVEQGRYEEAEPLHRRSLAIYEKNFGKDHSDVAMSLNNLALLFATKGKYDEAEPLYRRSLKIYEDFWGPNHRYVAESLNNLSRLHKERGEFDQAAELIDRAIDIRNQVSVSPMCRADSYWLRATISWELGERSDAVADLRRSMDLVEQQRGQFSGGEMDRAQAFSQLLSPFELMLEWQLELGDVSAALAAIERARARSLLDELQLSGADLQAGRSRAEREQMTATGLKLAARVTELEKRLQAAEEESKPTLEAELAQAKQDVYAHHHKVRTGSPVYRNLLSVGSAPPRLSQVRRKLLKEGDQLLVYYFGEEAGYLVWLTPKEQKLLKLEVAPELAELLGVKPGTLTTKLIKKILTDKESGLLNKLRAPRASKETEKQLEALSRVLLPGSLLDSVTSEKVKRLMVIPDGPLSLLPFDTLVVDTEPRTSYLLDVGPPILYGPSTTVLLNLQRRRGEASEAAKPVLTVGDPSYSSGGIMNENSLVTNLSAGSRYAGAGGALMPLPYSGREAKWVADAFNKRGTLSESLIGAAATEAKVRSAVINRKIVHLACHGLVDQSYGNFFGSLALTPGANPENPDDDGYLTLSEISRLDLSNCELAILSACDTNFGPEQRGEGVWALSRGFLVAGSKRVVASSWRVDDEAAASIVSVFCSFVAKDQERADAADYAEALHKAKKWARNQDKWKAPYYWATFSLVGPK